MAFVYPDCTSEFTTSTGIAPIIVLEGPEPSFGAFFTRMALGDETTVRREDGLNFELLRVRLLVPGTDGRSRLEVLARLDSSNAGAPVNWPAGQQRVFAVQLGRYALLPPDAGQDGRPVVVQPDGTFGPGALTLPVPTGLTLATLLDAASAGGRPDGAALIRLVVTWDAVPGLDYDLEIRDGLTAGWPGTASNPARIPAGGGRFVADVVGGYTYGVRLRARNIGGESDWTVEQTIAATGDDVPPGPPTDLVVTEVYGGAVFTFTPPADADTLEVRFYAAPTDDKTAAVLVGAGLRRVALTGLSAGTTRWVWAASADTSGNECPWVALGPVTALRIDAGDLAADLSERIERLSDVDPASLELAGEAALEAVLAAHEVRLGAQQRLDRAMTDVDATIDGVRDRLAGVETGIQQEATTRAGETEALTQSLTTLGAAVGENTAAIQAEQTARADGDSALAESVSLVAAQAGNALAAVQSEATARADEDGALAERIDAVVASSGATAAALAAEVTARADADGAIIESVTQLSAKTTNDIAAAIAEERTARTTAVDAVAQSVDALAAKTTEDIGAAVTEERTARTTAVDAVAQSVELLTTKMGEDIAAAILEERTAWTGADGALSTRIDAVKASADSNAAAIVAEQTARTDAVEAVVESVTQLAAQTTNDIAAAVSEEQTARTTAIEAVAQSVTQLATKTTSDIAAAVQGEATARTTAVEAVADSVDALSASMGPAITAAVQMESTARANADTALGQRIDTVQTAVNDVSAAVQTETNARTTAVSALAEQVTTVQTTVNGHTASIQQHAQSLGGLSAQWTLKLNAGGRAVGIGAAASEDVSELVFMADALKLVSTVDGAPVTPFAVIDGVVYINTALIGQGWIGDTHIGPNGIDAGLLRAGTVLAGSVKVGSTALSTVASNAATGAQDPAARINAGSTTLDPGKIIVKGSNTLVSVGGWFYEDTTEINGGMLRTGTVKAISLEAGTITSRELSTGQLISQSSQLGTATVTTLKIGENAVTLPITNYSTVEWGPPQSGTDYESIAVYSITSMGQPILVTVSMMEVAAAYSGFNNGGPIARHKIQRGQLIGGVWSWVDLVVDLGGSLAMADVTNWSGISRPWTYSVADRTVSAGAIVAYRLVSARLNNTPQIYTQVYRSITAMEIRR